MKEKELKEKKKEKKHEDQVEVLSEEKIEVTKEEVEEVNKKALEFEKKAIENEENYLRAKADLINYRKRKDEEVEYKLKYANEGLILDILPIIDNFERAIKLDNEKMGEETSNLLSGIKMIYASLNSTLEKYGVTEIKALGEKFDANYHQAVMTDEVADKEKEIILEVYQKGYMLKDKLLRPSMVKVNK